MDGDHFKTTDDFRFSLDESVLHIGFGPTRVSLNRAAAEDLSYRLSSFLTYLDHLEQFIPEAEAAQLPAEEPVSVLPDSVVPLRRTK